MISINSVGKLIGSLEKILRAWSIFSMNTLVGTVATELGVIPKKIDADDAMMDSGDSGLTPIKNYATRCSVPGSEFAFEWVG